MEDLGGGGEKRLEGSCLEGGNFEVNLRVRRTRVGVQKERL